VCQCPIGGYRITFFNIIKYPIPRFSSLILKPLPAKIIRFLLKVFVAIAATLVFSAAAAQDRVYLVNGGDITGKVKIIDTSQAQVHIQVDNSLDFVMYRTEVDSIVFSDGTVQRFAGAKTKQLKNAGKLNTGTYDVLALGFSTVSVSYERRIKSGLVGFRFSVYFTFIGATVPGYATFKDRYDDVLFNANLHYKLHNGGGYGGGFNPRFYLIRRALIRPFIGPEAAVAYSFIKFFDTKQQPNYELTRKYGTADGIGNAGVSFGAGQWVIIVVDGGVGAAYVWGNPSPLGWTGIWRLGVSFGANF
jgi:hypothetical protein